MERIQLSKGLIAIGGSAGIGKTRFTLKLANQLSKNEKVLFISYQDYREHSVSILEEMGDQQNKNLKITTNIGYFNVASILQLIKHIETNSFTTVFIDDIDGFKRGQFIDFNDEEKNSVIEALGFIAKLLDVRIVFNLTLKWYNSSFQFIRPGLRDFDWSRNIVTDCTQIYAINRPFFYEISEDEEGNSVENLIEIISLKNEQNKIKILNLDNSELKVFNKGKWTN
jgi:hypothetical protein